MLSAHVLPESLSLLDDCETENQKKGLGSIQIILKVTIILIYQIKLSSKLSNFRKIQLKFSENMAGTLSSMLVSGS